MWFSRVVIIFTIITTSIVQSYSQTSQFFVHFSDKNNTPFDINSPDQFLSDKAIDRRQRQGINVTSTDLPVNPLYVDSLTSLGANVIYTSKWMNAAYIELDSSQIPNIYTLDFVVDGYETTRKGKPKTNKSFKFSGSTSKNMSMNSIPDYGVTESGFELIGVDDMNGLGFDGQGVTIAVLDAGFDSADTISYLSHLFNNSQVISTYDFVDHETNVYDNDKHGLNVLSIMASNQENSIVGGTPNADYILLRTEEESQETIAEMIFWLVAAEYADSSGADIINCSLGYNEFDNPLNSYSYSDFDGQTTIITQAAELASQTGMLVVTSAGNEGNVAWEKVTAPADGPSVLAVGAVNSSGNYASFSSKGPTFDGRIKPNVVAQGQSTGIGNPTGTTGFSNGTSFAAPQITSLAAGLWQALPELTNTELKEIIERSAHQFETPDNEIGYGIPNFLLAYNLGLSISSGNVISSNNKVFPNPFTSGNIYLILGQEETQAEVEIQLTTLNGQNILIDKIESPEISNKIDLELATLSTGVYFLKIKTQIGTTIHRLVKI